MESSLLWAFPTYWFCFLPSLCPQSLETLHTKPPSALARLWQDAIRERCNRTRCSGSFFTVKFRPLFNMNLLYELTGVFREMTLPSMMALLTLERTFPFIPWGVKCIMDIFNLSALHHSSHLSNVLWTEYPVYTSNPCSFFPSCVGV